MGYNQFSKPIQPREYTSPIDLDVYGKGLLLNEQNMQKTRAELQSAANSFLNIQPMSIQDEEVLNQRKAEFQEAVKNLDVSSLNNPQTASRINTLISRFANDPDVQSVATRSAQVNKELQTKRDFESKGKTYVSPLLRQADKYISDGKYYRDTRFNQSGFVAPDNKDIADWAKSTPEYERWVRNGAYDDHLKGKAVSSLQANILNGFKTNPNWVKLHKDNFEQQLEGQDLSTYLDNPSQTISDLFPHLPPELQPKAAQYVEGLQSLKGNPYAESAIKARLEDLYLQDQAYLAAQAHTYANTVDHKVNEFAKSYNDFQEAKALKLYEHQLDQQYPKGDDKEVMSLVQGLEEFKTHKSGIPGLLNTPIFQKDVYSPEESQEYELDSDGNKTLKKSTVKNVKKKVAPEAVGYRKSDDTFTIRYEDGTVDQLTTQQIVDKVATAKPALAKYLANTTSDVPVITTQEQYNKLPAGTKYKDSQGNIATKK